MRTAPEKNTPNDEIDLDLPALDGEDDHAATDDDGSHHHDGMDLGEEGGKNALDDATGEDGPLDELEVEGTEAGWLVDAENAGTLDVGPFDVALEPEGKVLVDDEADPSGSPDDLISAGDETYVADSGEEGPTDDDEELREEDLPALDADEDGDVPDEDLFDRGLLGTDEDLRWDDRAWARAPDAIAAAPSDEAEDSGVLAVPGDDAEKSPRDAAWKRLDESGRVMAAAFVPGDSVAVALSSSDRSRAYIVRIRPDGEARIIAEIDPNAARKAAGGPRDEEDEEGTVCTVSFVRWDAARGCLFVGGNFGVEAYRPVLQ